MFFAKKTDDAPPEVYSARIYLTALVIAWGACLFGYDSSYIGTTLTLPSFQRDFGLAGLSRAAKANASANIVSSFQAGAFFGAAFGFPLMERWGRKIALIIATVVFVVGSILQTAVVDQISMIYAGRVLVGLGVGTITAASPVFLAEISPPAIRGTLVGFYEIMYQVGALVGFWIVFGINSHQDVTKSKAWRIPMAVQLIPSGILLIGLFFVRETPRFLLKQGQRERAVENLCYLRQLPADHPYILAEVGAIEGQIRDVQMLHSREEQEGAMAWFFAYWRGIWRYVSAKGIRNRMAIGFCMMMFQYYSPTIFASIGVSNVSLYTGIFGALKAFASVVFLGFFVDLVGRRKPLLIGGITCAICMIYVGVYIKIGHPSAAVAGSASTVAGGKAGVAAIFIFGMSFAASWNGLAWIICSEIYPLKIRGFCAAYTAMCQWFFQFIIARTTPYMVNSLGWGMFILFGGFCVASVLFAFFCIPELKGLSLEDMDRLFGYEEFDAFTGKADRREEEKDLESSSN